MNENLKNEFAKLTQQPQRQDSTIEQMRDLRDFANKLGLYDAADLIKQIVAASDLKPTNSPP